MHLSQIQFTLINDKKNVPINRHIQRLMIKSRLIIFVKLNIYNFFLVIKYLINRISPIAEINIPAASNTVTNVELLHTIFINAPISTIKVPTKKTNRDLLMDVCMITLCN